MNYYLLHTTYPILFISVFARQLCLPVAAILFLLCGGALASADATACQLSQKLIPPSKTTVGSVNPGLKT